MQYVDTPFPPRLAFGARSEAGWQTQVGRNQGGFEATNQDWSDNRHYFDVALAVRTQSDYADVRAHFNVMRGRAKSFPFTDPLDHEVAQSEGQVLSATRAAISANGTYYLHKRYGSGADAYDRRITRPDNPGIVYRTRSAITTNITGAGAVITYTTGAVAITGHLSGDTYAWAGSFVVPCRYDVDRLPGVIVNKQPRHDEPELYVETGSIPICEVRE